MKLMETSDASITGRMTGWLSYGLSNPVIRPVMLASLVSMSFMIFGFYSWQRYFLDLLGRNLVWVDRKSTRLNSSHLGISYAVFCLKKKNRPLSIPAS